MVFQDAPIYDRLIAERGDIPAEVRGEAERTLRHLDQIMRSGVPAPGTPEHIRPGAFG